MITGWRRLLLAALLALAGGSSTAAPLPVPIGGEESIPVGRYITLLADPGGELDLAGAQAAEAAGKFSPPPGPVSSLGFRSGATWIHFQLRNDTGAAMERWLRSGWPFLQSATLYLIDGTGKVHRLENGSRLAPKERPLPSVTLMYPLRLAPGETQSAYLRISTRTATIIDLTLWEPAAYANGQHGEAALRFFISGSTLVVIVFSLLAWQARRQRALLSLAGAQVCMMDVAFGLDGYFAPLLPAGDGLVHARLLWLFLFLAMGLQAMFARAFLQLPQNFPRLNIGMAATTWLCFILAGYAYADYQPSLLGTASIVVSSALTVVAIIAGWRLGSVGRFYFAAWGLFWVAVTLRMLQHLGVANSTPFLGLLPIFAFGVSSLVLSCALYLDIRAVRRAGEETHRQFLELQQSEQDRLLAAVDSRTRELQEAMARAEAANQAKSAFLSAVNHELRTPLHTILGYTELLQRQLAGEARDKLTIIANSSAQLLRLIDNVLDFSRGEAFSVDLQLEPVGLRQLVAKLEDGSRILAGRRGNRFAVVLGDDLPAAVEADESRLTQLLQNLIGNACKYTEQGDVRLIVGIEPGARCSTPHGTWYRLRFTIEDSGIGIPAAELAHIFAPFSRVSGRQRQPGVGLGLPIARQLARAMGGDITVESAAGAGSKFHVILPMREAVLEESAPTPIGTATVNGYRGRQLTLLVADDIAENRTILTELFSRLGFAVLTADDGDKALALCLAADPPIDAALVDQFMPTLDGWGFLRAIRSSPAHAALPVILISAATPKRPDDLPPGQEFDRTLMKPLRLEQLAGILQEILGFEWTASEKPAIASPPTVPAPPFPVTPVLEEFRDLLSLGKVLALQRWAQALAQRHPEYTPFCDRVGQLSRAVDLAGLKRLLDEAEGQL